MVFYRSLSDNKLPQVSRTFLSIVADLNNAVILMISNRAIISKFSNPIFIFPPWVTVPSTPITIVIIFTFNFHRFFSSLKSLVINFSFRFLPALPCDQLERQSPQFGRFYSLLTINTVYVISGWKILCIVISFIHFFDGVSFQYSQVFVYFLFSRQSGFSRFVCSVRSVIYRFWVVWPRLWELFVS